MIAMQRWRRGYFRSFHTRLKGLRICRKTGIEHMELLREGNLSPGLYGMTYKKTSAMCR